MRGKKLGRFAVAAAACSAAPSLLLAQTRFNAAGEITNDGFRLNGSSLRSSQYQLPGYFGGPSTKTNGVWIGGNDSTSFDPSDSCQVSGTFVPAARDVGPGTCPLPRIRVRSTP